MVGNQSSTNPAPAVYPSERKVAFIPSHPVAVDDRYSRFGRQVEILRRGSTFAPAAMLLPCDISWERDVEVTLRDGTRIYADVLKPTGAGTVPSIVAWSPYGKPIPATIPPPGVSLYWQSALAKFEGPDPAGAINNAALLSL